MCRRKLERTALILVGPVARQTGFSRQRALRADYDRRFTTRAAGFRPMRAGIAAQTQDFRRSGETACAPTSWPFRSNDHNFEGRSRRRAAPWPPFCHRFFARPIAERQAEPASCDPQHLVSGIRERASPRAGARRRPLPRRRSASHRNSTLPRTRECRSSKPWPSFVILAKPPAMVTLAPDGGADISACRRRNRPCRSARFRAGHKRLHRLLRCRCPSPPRRGRGRRRGRRRCRDRC